jgi:hypothetical protein
MKPYLIRFTLASTVGACFAVSASAQAPEWLPLVIPVVEAVDGPPAEKFKAKYKPVVMVDETAADLDAGSAFGVPIKIVTREQVRTEQRAYFIRFGKVQIEGDRASVLYSVPSSGHFGKVTLARTDGAWKVTDKTESHSSSAARNAYGAIFDGVFCADGSEMAKRWNYHHTMQQSLMAGKPFDFGSSAPAVCPGKEFPEVLAYRQSKTAAK